MFSETKVKSLLVLVLFVAVFTQTLCYPSSHIEQGSHGGHGGSSSSRHHQDHHGNYEFNYDVRDPMGGSNFRKEKGHGHDKDNSVEGTYGLTDVDGRMRVVQYWADHNGFRAKIKSNEPGVGNEDAADAIYNGQGHESGAGSAGLMLNVL